MKLTIDNLDGLGALDYTAFVDTSKHPRLAQANSPSELKVGLVGGLVGCCAGDQRRISLTLDSGNDLFTGYIAQTPAYQYEGWADRGPVYRYEVDALSDVMLMDRKRRRASSFVDRSGAARSISLRRRRCRLV